MEGQAAAPTCEGHLPEVRRVPEDRLLRHGQAREASLPGALGGPHRARGPPQGGVAFPAGADQSADAHD
eukprot:15095027-Alexandrium_andersonii.AAC.1